MPQLFLCLSKSIANIVKNRERSLPANGTGPSFRRMHLEFELARVWPSMRHGIQVSQYTCQGDPLKIDCGYRFKAVVKMFHATPLRTDLNTAKVLAFSFPLLAEGIMKAEGAQAQLIAVIEDNLERADDALGFAMDVLERQSIRILPLSQMPEVAQQAAREIGIS